MALVASRFLGKSAHRARTFLFQQGARLVLLCALAGGSVPLHAQLLDSLALFGRERPRFVAKLDSRGSFISNSNVRLIGVKAGVEHAGRFQYGLGYSFLAGRVENGRKVDGRTDVPVRLQLGYVTPYMEYAFYQRGPWEVRIPVQFGIGRGSVWYDDLEGNRRLLHRSLVFFYEPTMTVQYRLLRYFGVNVGWGFRLQLVRTGLGETLSAPVYLVGLKVFMGDLWADLKR